MNDTKPKHAGGRPTKYKGQETLDKARHYLEHYKDTGDVIPTHAGVACELGICMNTFYRWCNDPEKEEFSHIADEVMAKQQRNLLNQGLTGEYNSSIAKLMLTKHDYAIRLFSFVVETLMLCSVHHT